MIRIVVIEDHKEFNAALCQLIGGSSNLLVINSFLSAEDFLSKEIDFDLLLLDMELPGMSGLDAIPIIKKKYPDSKIVMLTVFEDEQKIFNAICSGANGYLLKRISPEALIASIRESYEGGTPLSPIMAKKVLNVFMNQISTEKKESNLSPREIEVLKLLVEGFNRKQIANKLFISPETVSNHLRHIYEKLQVHSKSQAVAKAIKERIV